MVMVDGAASGLARKPPAGPGPGMNIAPNTGYRIGQRVLQGQHAEFCRVPERAVRRAAARAAARAGEETILTAFQRHQPAGEWRVLEPKPWGWLVWTGNSLKQQGVLDLIEVVVIDPVKANTRRRSDRIRHTMAKGYGRIQRPTALSGYEPAVAAMGAVAAYAAAGPVPSAVVGLLAGWMALIPRQMLLETQTLRYPHPTNPAVPAALLIEAASRDPRFAHVLTPLLPSLWQLLHQSSVSVDRLPVVVGDLVDALSQVNQTRHPLRHDEWTAARSAPAWFADGCPLPVYWPDLNDGPLPVEDLYRRAIDEIRLSSGRPLAGPTSPAPPAPEPMTPPAPAPLAADLLAADLLAETVALYAEVDAEWTEFCTDPYSIFIRPLINDVTEPATAAFFERREAAEQLAPLAVATPTASRTAKYHQAVLDLSDAWAAADTNARSVGLTRMDTATKRTLNRARSALNRALDERTPAAERRICCDLIVQLLGGAAAVPEPIRRRLVHQLETTHRQIQP